MFKLSFFPTKHLHGKKNANQQFKLLFKVNYLSFYHYYYFLLNGKSIKTAKYILAEKWKAIYVRKIYYMLNLMK